MSNWKIDLSVRMIETIYDRFTINHNGHDYLFGATHRKFDCEEIVFVYFLSDSKKPILKKSEKHAMKREIEKQILIQQAK